MAQKTKGNNASANNPISPEMAIIAVIAILAFAVSAYYFSGQLREHDVRGLKVLSKGDPELEMRSALSGKIIIKAYAFPGEDIRNSYVALVTAEIAGALSSANRNSSTFAYVAEAANASERLIGCTTETDFCSNEKLVVQIDPCNCLKIEDGKIYVLYDIDKLKQDALRVQLRGVFGGVAMEEKGG
ncbi:MAG: hypothetical protein ABH863_05855 [Candidatus Micrarchaeota archaeon]